jgi:hypothetical protein
VRESERHVYISTANTLVQIQPASMTGLAKVRIGTDNYPHFHIYISSFGE